MYHIIKLQCLILTIIKYICKTLNMDPTSSNPSPPPDLPQPISPPKKSYLKPFLLISTVIIILIAGTIVYDLIHTKAPTIPNEIQISPSPTLDQHISPSITQQITDNIILGGITLPYRPANELKPIIKNKNIYYVKSGDVWMANVNNDNKVTKKLVFEGHGKILDYTISNNEKLLAYTSKKNEYPLMDGPNGGDTVVLVDLADKTEKEIFSGNLEGDQLNGIIFSPDNKKLYFTNTKIHIYNLETRLIATFTSTAKPFSMLCSFDPYSFSPSSRYLLLGFFCWEGGSQIVFDTQTGETSGIFDVGYISGGIGATGFLTDATILGYDNRTDYDFEPKEWTVGIYNINGSLIKNLGKYDIGYNSQLMAYFDFDSSIEKAYISLPKELHSKENILYEIDRQTQNLKQIILKSDLLLQFVESPNLNPTLKIQYFRPSNGAMIDIDRLVEYQDIFIR